MAVREQLLEAAARVYASAGYRGATTRRIANAAGVNEITIFRQFGSKDALLREAIVRAGEWLAEEALPDRPNDPLRELHAWARAHVAGLRERRSLIRTLMAEIAEHPDLLPAAGSPPARAAKALGEYLRRLREAGLATAAFDEAAAAASLMGVLFADAMGRDVMPDMYSTPPDRALAEYLGLFLRGIGAPAQ